MGTAVDKWILREKIAAMPSIGPLLAAGGAGALAAGVPIAMMARAHEQKARARAGNVGFGAGMATGLATPTIIRGLYDMTQGASQ